MSLTRCSDREDKTQSSPMITIVSTSQRVILTGAGFDSSIIINTFLFIVSDKQLMPVNFTIQPTNLQVYLTHFVKIKREKSTIIFSD